MYFTPSSLYAYARYDIIYTQGVMKLDSAQHLHSPVLHLQLYKIKFEFGTSVFVTYESPQVQVEPQPFWSLRGSLALQMQPWQIEILVEHLNH